MKLGIITFHATHNYGAVLQAHALQEFLLSEGHDPFFVNYRPAYVETTNRKIPKIIGVKSLFRYLALIPFQTKLARRYKSFEKYRGEHLRMGDCYRDFEELEKNPPKLDVYICGSDQIWNMENGGNPLYFLRFLNVVVPSIAYAPSFGSDCVPLEFEKRFKNWAKTYRYLSVREHSGKILAEQLLNRKIPQVLDPIFLQKRSFWRKLAGKRLLGKDFIAFYSLETGNRLSACIAKVSNFLRLPIVVIGKPGVFILKGSCKIAIDAGPKEFLSYISHASMVVTNSFHATAFAAYLNVPFVTIAHSTRNTRMDSLLQLLDQEFRLIENLDELTNELLQRLLERPEVNKSEKFIESQKNSQNFLTNSLNSIESSLKNI